MRRGALAALALVGLLSSACQTNGMQFQRDDVITILSPGLREHVALPVLVEWEPNAELQQLLADDPGGVMFGVFVDRAPIARGAQLAEVVNRNCNRRDGCMDAEELEDRGIHLTASPRVLLDDLDDLRRRDDPDALDIHAVTIVVLRRGEDRSDGELAVERADETSYRVEFVVEREGEA